MDPVDINDNNTDVHDTSETHERDEEYENETSYGRLDDDDISSVNDILNRTADALNSRRSTAVRRRLRPLPRAAGTTTTNISTFSNIPEIVTRIRNVIHDGMNASDSNPEQIVFSPLYQQSATRTQSNVMAPTFNFTSIPLPIPESTREESSSINIIDRVDRIKEKIAEIRTYKNVIDSAIIDINNAIMDVETNMFIIQDDLNGKTNKCKICYGTEANIVLLPCTHLGLCTGCYNNIKRSGDVVCPYCRTSSRGYLNVVLP